MPNRLDQPVDENAKTTADLSFRFAPEYANSRPDLIKRAELASYNDARHLPALAITGSDNANLSVSTRDHRGPRPEDNYRVEKLGPNRFRVHDSKQHDLLDSAIVKVERDRLFDIIEKQMHRTYETRLVADMVRFEERSRGKLSKEEVADTYKQVARLLEHPGKLLGREDVRRLARDVMLHAATPGSVDQGGHGTCAVTAIESRMYALYPSQAARLVVDVATTGKYVAGDSTSITLEKRTVQPDQEARSYREKVGVRSHSTQLFNIVANNLAFVQSNYRYESPATGEIVKDYTTTPPVPLDFMGLDSTELVKVNDRILGKAEPEAMLSNTQRDAATAGLKFSSEADLEKCLNDLKKKNLLPVIVEVDTSQNPLWTDQGGGGGGGHVVTVTDYLPGKPAKVLVDNQWGFTRDHQRGAAMTLHDFYMTTLPHSAALPIIEKELVDKKAAGGEDYSRELDVARHEYNLGMMSNKDLGHGVATVSTKLSQQWSKQFGTKEFDREQFNRDKSQIRLLLNTVLEPENRLPALKSLVNASGFSHTEVDGLIGHALRSIDKNPHLSVADRSKLLADYRVLLNGLPAHRRAEVMSVRYQR